MFASNVPLSEFRAWLASLKPNVYLTFNFGYRVSLEVGGDFIVRF